MKGSLQRRLALRISAAVVVVCILVGGLVVFRANVTSEMINEKTLEIRAAAIRRAIHSKPDGELAVRLPSDLEDIFSPAHRENIYFVKSASGRVIAASHPQIEALARQWRVDDADSPFIRLTGVFDRADAYYGLAQETTTPYGPMLVVVAQSGQQRAFADYIVWEFMERFSWVIPLLVILVIAITVLTIRMSFRHLHAISGQVRAINPNSSHVAVSTEGLPQEIVPFVGAMNQAFERLQKGLEAERRFTANAAHELRTPLSILKARIDDLAASSDASDDDLNAVRRDVDRMSRVVTQLLAAARLEMVRESGDVLCDLADVTRDVVTQYAPLAIDRGQAISTDLPDQEVCCDAARIHLYEAVRNLIENAICYSPKGTEITVALDETGTLRVIDTGPGVPDRDKERIFERFFRGNRTASDGSGLGLSIVREFARRYGGDVVVEDTPGGGATFVLSLPPAIAGTRQRPGTPA